jgi:hypothetical protein
MIGYVLGGIMIETEKDWRLAIVAQLFFLLPLTLTHLLVFPADMYGVSAQGRAVKQQRSSENFETQSDSNSDDDDVIDDSMTVKLCTSNTSSTDNLSEIDGLESSPTHQSGDVAFEVAAEDFSGLGVWDSLLALFKCDVYIFMSFGLASLYFVVSGIQFWVTRYLTEVLGVPRRTVLICFTLTSITAPVLGVIMSGWILDKLGGYKGTKGTTTATKACFVFAVIACAFAIPAGLVGNFIVVICCLWITLLFGGGVVPIASGVIIDSVPEGLQAFGFSLSICIYQVIGYGAGTFVPGLFIQVLETNGQSDNAALQGGWRMVMLWGGWAVFFLGLTHRRALRHEKAEEAGTGKTVIELSSITTHDGSVDFEIATVDSPVHASTKL